MKPLEISLDKPVPGMPNGPILNDMLTNREVTQKYQQVVYDDPKAVFFAMDLLREAPPMTTLQKIQELKNELAEVVKGDAVVLQAGLCAEVMDETPEQTAEGVVQFSEMMHGLEKQMIQKTGKKTVLLGRIAGQLTKPRSNAYEVIDGKEVPTFHGDMIHGMAVEDRTPTPQRLIKAYRFCHGKSQLLDDENANSEGADIHASHEALSLPYEYGLLQEVNGKIYAGSAPYLWIGDRTRQLDGPHVALAALVENPVGVKINAKTKPEELEQLINIINPKKEPGKLSLVFRMGHDKAEEGLPALLDVAAQYKDSVIVMCDPMHGNTETDEATQKKTRKVANIAKEAVTFAQLCNERGIHPGGIHIEAAAEEVTECLGVNVNSLQDNYKTLCDPCMNPAQAGVVTRQFGQACGVTAKKAVLA